MDPKAPIKVFNYLDYRKFLADLYIAKKAGRKYFTLQYVSQQLGLKSPGYFSWILKGKRNVSPKLIVKLSELFQLGKRESMYFELLVNYNQAGTAEEKKYFFEKITTLTTASGRTVKTKEYEFYEKWYNSAIRELIAVNRFRDTKDDYSRMAKSLSPPITAAEARKGVRLLVKLGFVYLDEQGYYRRNEPTLTTGDNWKAEAITHFQLSAMDLAKESLDCHHRSKRNVSTLTLSCSEDTYNSIKTKIINLYQEIENIVRMDPNPEGVYQCNFQLFPLSRKMRRKKDA
jgi:uncharacterized protein (TIGR02147 family)